MKKQKISKGVAHTLPEDLRKAISSSQEVFIAWEGITPLARNEWICWITSAKKLETRTHRIERMQDELKEGKHRPCCWPGCPHR
jgi:uncharacterized protein YdeI (YjbR/CyaY-like superfamily)